MSSSARRMYVLRAAAAIGLTTLYNSHGKRADLWQEDKAKTHQYELWLLLRCISAAIGSGIAGPGCQHVGAVVTEERRQQSCHPPFLIFGGQEGPQEAAKDAHAD